jgi:hypothetical protein
MSSRNDRFEYRLATPADSPRILEIMESGDFSGRFQSSTPGVPTRCSH